MLVPSDQRSNALVSSGSDSNKHGVTRTSSFDAPYYELSGHTSEVLSVAFSSTGRTLASCGMDHSIRQWHTSQNVYFQQTLNHHRAPVLDISWGGSDTLYSVCANGWVNMWDVQSESLVQSTEAHTSIINACVAVSGTSSQVLSAGDDGFVRCTDVRMRGSGGIVIKNKYPCTALEVSACGSFVFFGDTSGRIQMYDLDAVDESLLTFHAHSDAVTTLRRHPSSSVAQLSSSARDHMIHVWDTTPVPLHSDQMTALYTCIGAAHPSAQVLLRNAWCRDGLVWMGSGRTPYSVCAWMPSCTVDARGATIEPILVFPGHTSCVTAISVHPVEPFIATCSQDGMILAREYAHPSQKEV